MWVGVGTTGIRCREAGCLQGAPAAKMEQIGEPGGCGILGRSPRQLHLAQRFDSYHLEERSMWYRRESRPPLVKDLSLVLWP